MISMGLKLYKDIGVIYVYSCVCIEAQFGDMFYNDTLTHKEILLIRCLILFFPICCRMCGILFLSSNLPHMC